MRKVDPGEVVQCDEPIRYYEKGRDVPDPILAGRPVRKMWPSEGKRSTRLKGIFVRIRCKEPSVVREDRRARTRS